MPTFNYQFTIEAPQTAVAAFHHDTSVLKILTPPPLFVQLHYFEPLGEGSRAKFTLWFGPLPVHWLVVHTNVNESGFTDTQVAGPLKMWQHRHEFVAVGSDVTEVKENITYEYGAGFRGLINRFMYSKFSLTLLFTARKIITRRHIKKSLRSNNV